MPVQGCGPKYPTREAIEGSHPAKEYVDGGGDCLNQRDTEECELSAGRGAYKQLLGVFQISKAQPGYIDLDHRNWVIQAFFDQG